VFLCFSACRPTVKTGEASSPNNSVNATSEATEVVSPTVSSQTAFSVTSPDPIISQQPTTSPNPSVTSNPTETRQPTTTPKPSNTKKPTTAAPKPKPTSTKKPTITPKPTNSGPKTITVSSAQAFVNAIGSNTTIILKDGTYNLSAISQSGALSTNDKYWESVDDGKQLHLQRISNLTIQAASSNCKIIVSPRYANVLTFSNCSNIKITGITAGHTTGGECMGGVFYFEDTTGVQITNCHMYGCGTEGLTLYNVRNMQVNNSTIYQCTSDIMSVSDSYNITFTNCIFRDTICDADYAVSITGTQNFIIDKCQFNNLKIYSDEFSDGDMFSVEDSSGIYIKNSSFNSNIFDNLDPSGIISFQNDTYSD